MRGKSDLLPSLGCTAWLDLEAKYEPLLVDFIMVVGELVGLPLLAIV